jgi:thiol-disulfide isomerase/thioredoxin
MSQYYFMRIFFLFYFVLFCFTSTVYAQPPMLQNIDGHEITLKSLKGKWVYINYWASWCAPCLHEIPEINHFYQQYKNKNIMVFGVNYDGLPLEQQRELIQKYQLSYPSLGIDPADALKLGDIKGVPVTFIFNPEGKLFDIKYGEQTIKSLSAYL